MRYGSTFSGIEAATVAWQPLGWKAQFFSEIEPFPCAVLAHHYPAVPNLGDVTKHKDWPHAAIDLLVGGSPCQAFSVAGLRKGLDDPRGNLTLTYLAVVDQYRPRWVVWENVPGVLSVDGGRVFGAFLGGLGQLGYGFAYRVLDAQHFGVPQRRRRVFVVGHLGDWRRAAAVLFERHSLQGHPPPRREARKGIARPIAAGSASSGGYRNDADTADNLIPMPHADISPAIKARDSKGPSSDGDGDGAILVPMVAHSLRAEGFDASEDGTGRGTPLVPVAFDSRQDCISSTDHFGSLGSSSPQAQAVPLRGREGGATAELSEIPSALRASGGGGDKAHVLTSMQVRRLTPRECERLQGFTDDYTLVAVRGKPAADGPRYKALGNSMAVPCMRWIGERIALVDSLA